jgi:hypothetical protein
MANDIGGMQGDVHVSPAPGHPCLCSRVGSVPLSARGPPLGRWPHFPSPGQGPAFLDGRGRGAVGASGASPTMYVATYSSTNVPSSFEHNQHFQQARPK